MCQLHSIPLPSLPYGFHLKAGGLLLTSLLQLSNRFGFLDTGADNGGMIAALDHYLRYLSKVGIYHEWHSFLTWCLSFFPNSGSRYLGIFTQQQVAEGQKSKPKSLLEKDEAKPTDDFLTKLLRMHALQPDKFSMKSVFSTCITNIGAGSDTTSVSLAGILHQLMKSPATVKKVGRLQIVAGDLQG